MPNNENNSKKQRRLAAIMFTDMVVYSALTQKNESLAIELLEEYRQLLRPIFPKHGGREVETVGDAFFVEFKSALESVNCAIEIQRILFERNSERESEKKIVLRIGLHVGDVIQVGPHVHGDGVNIAARLEPLSKPGGICLSEDVARQIQNKIDVPIKVSPIRIAVLPLVNLSDNLQSEYFADGMTEELISQLTKIVD